MERVKALRPLEDPATSLPFIKTILSSLRGELQGTEATLLGFVGTPWTLAAYSIEGAADKECKKTKVRRATHTGCGRARAWRHCL